MKLYYQPKKESLTAITSLYPLDMDSELITRYRVHKYSLRHSYIS